MFRQTGKRYWSSSLLLKRRSFGTTAGQKSPVVLCILDGWGYRPDIRNNAVLSAKTPNFDKLWSKCSQRGRLSFLNACEEHVGLPAGQIGNSEVGHMNIGAGRIVYQDISRIDNSINDGLMDSNEALLNHINALKKSGGKCHVMGLTSPGGVHSHQRQMSFLANLIAAHGVPVVVHAFTDGRDVPPQGARDSFPEFISSLSENNISVGTVSGRYYAMDRDHRWERVIKAFDVIRYGNEKSENPVAPDAMNVIEDNYKNDITDEFIIPSVVGDYDGMKDGDGILMTNFRADRAREILQLFTSPESANEAGVVFKEMPQFAAKTGLVSYSKSLDEHLTKIMDEKDLTKMLGEVVAGAGKTQLRMAETEKYPHVTFFFNGGREEPFDNEERIMVPSPKVATYDLQPQMSAYEVGAKLCNAIRERRFDMIIINFANPDMVGHTGVLAAAMKAVEAVDENLGHVIEAIDETQGKIIVTADHGNCEQMWNYEIDEPHTAHTLNKVPCFLYGTDEALLGFRMSDGALCDLAPTMLQLLEMEQPGEMTGKSLILVE